MNEQGSGTSITMMKCDVGFFVEPNCAASIHFIVALNSGDRNKIRNNYCTLLTQAHDQLSDMTIA